MRLYIFIFLASLGALLHSGYANVVTNGSLDVLVFLLHEKMNNSLFLRTIDEIEEYDYSIEEIHILLNKYNICHECVSLDDPKELFLTLNENEFVVYEIHTAKKNFMDMICMAKKGVQENVIFYTFPNFKEKTYKISNLPLNFLNSFGEKYIIVGNGRKCNLVESDFKRSQPKKNSELHLHPKMNFTEYTHGEKLKIPDYIDIGMIPRGILNITALIPIENISKFDVNVNSVRGECRCIRSVKYSKLIQPKETKYIELIMDLTSYQKKEIIETSINISTDDNLLKHHSVNIIGFIDASTPFIVTPASLFKVYLPGNECLFEIFFYSKSDTSFVVKMLSDTNNMMSFSEKNLDKQYNNKLYLLKILSVSVDVDKLKKGKNLGRIYLNIDFDSKNYNYSIPYEIIK